MNGKDALFFPMFSALLVANFAFFGIGIFFGASLDDLNREPSVPTVVGNLSDAYAEDVLIVRNNFGGGIGSYAQRWQAVTQMELNVVIDGECVSACTHVLWQVPAERVCITKNARFGFHLASVGGIALPELTKDLDRHYPPQVRAWLATQARTLTDIVYLPEEIMRQLYRICGDMEVIYGE